MLYQPFIEIARSYGDELIGGGHLNFYMNNGSTPEKIGVFICAGLALAPIVIVGSFLISRLCGGLSDYGSRKK